MLKKLQLITICIFVVVILLSQFTQISGSDEAFMTDILEEKAQEEMTDKLEDKLGLGSDNIESKYTQPISELKSFLNEGTKLFGNLKGSTESLKEIMDIEENLNELKRDLK